MKEKEISVVYGLYNVQEEREQARWSLGYILEDFADIKKRYVTLGFHLDEFNRGQYYKDFGYLTFEEFCAVNIPMDKSAISRCISVFQMFADVDKSHGLVSRKMWLAEKYTAYSYSQLVEMVSLPSPVVDLIPHDMTIAKIREVKKYIKQHKVFDSYTVGKVRKYIQDGCPSGEAKVVAMSQPKEVVEPGMEDEEDTPLYSSEQLDGEEFIAEMFKRIQKVLVFLSLDIHAVERSGKQLSFRDLDGNNYSLLYRVSKKKEES